MVSFRVENFFLRRTRRWRIIVTMYQRIKHRHIDTMIHLLLLMAIHNVINVHNSIVGVQVGHGHRTWATSTTVWVVKQNFCLLTIHLSKGVFIYALIKKNTNLIRERGVINRYKWDLMRFFMVSFLSYKFSHTPDWISS